MIRIWTVVLLAAICGGEDPVTSPSGALFARYTLCSMQNPCIPEVVITGRDGAEVRRFEVRTDEGPCMSLFDVVCHGNPSVNYYYEVDIASAILYPLPPRRKPVDLKRLERAPDVVIRRGLVHRGVHNFQSRFVWSPDSRRMASSTVWWTIACATILQRHSKSMEHRRTYGASPWQSAWMERFEPPRSVRSRRETLP